MAGTRTPKIDPVGTHHEQVVMRLRSAARSLAIVAVIVSAHAICAAQATERELRVGAGGAVRIVNRHGRVSVSALPATDPDKTPTGRLTARGSRALAETEIKVTAAGSRTVVEVMPSSANVRIDLLLSLPERINLEIETDSGEVIVSGNFERVAVATETGTIAADVPTDNIKYDLEWTQSRPRYLSDFQLESVKERSGGRFVLKGNYKAGETEETKKTTASGDSENRPADTDITLKFTTARGIVLLNVPPNEVSSDLRERPLTNAAKAIIRSGDLVLTDAIRRASPKHFGDYARTLPPSRKEPILSEASREESPQGALKRADVRVTDQFNRAVTGLRPADFVITENGVEREIVSVEPVTAPFNLVLLVDVSGSVDNYVDFIRKAARSFVDTVDRSDRISIVLFNDDVKVLSQFTTDKQKLSQSLDTFDAGGATAYYDALAYTLADTLRPLRGERTAIVVLTDGDDNRSFLSFDGLIGAIEESGALIYPLYVPSALVAASATNRSEDQIDPLRTRYNGLTSKADGEGARLAAISGGIYYPITQLSQIQKAYDDIVVQLRTAYSVTFRSSEPSINSTRVSPRTKVRVRRPNTFAAIGPISRVTDR